MKKITKLLLLSLFAILLVLSVVTIAACDNNERLPMPEGLRISGANFMWTAVPNATGYYVQINDNSIINVGVRTSHSIASLEGGIHTLRVRAAGDGTNFNDSDWAILTHRAAFTITYVLNGGTNHASNPSHYMPESELITLQDPTRDGFTFLGWTEGNTILANSIGNKTFSAIWELATFTITYQLSGGTNHDDNPKTFTIESSLIALQAPTKEDYVFVRWAEGGAILAGSIGDKTFTAVWTIRGTEGLEYTLSSNSQYYMVSRGTATGNIGTDIIIQEFYNGLPVTRIRDFRNYAGLTTAVIPDFITTIGGNAFNGSINLRSVELPNTLTAILGNAFRDTALESIVIPSSMTVINSAAFSGAANLKNVETHNAITIIESSAFAGCINLESITIPNSITTIESGAFSNTGLISVVIPDSVTSLGNNVFQRSSNLTSVVIGASITTIPAGAFESCVSLTSIVIPSSITRIETRAFNLCSALETINFRGTQDQWGRITIGTQNTFLAFATVNFSWIG